MTANQKGKQLINFSQISVVEENHSDGEILAISNGDSKPFEEWVVDSSCKFHMCPNQD